VADFEEGDRGDMDGAALDPFRPGLGVGQAGEGVPEALKAAPR
jgi:hypothetical protein